MIADYHIHTHFSGDSESLIPDLAERALQLGFEEICLTDHLDYDAGGLDRVFDWNARNPEIAAFKTKYEGRLRIRNGVEFGVQTHTIPQYEHAYSATPYDFVILSCHEVDGQEFWTGEFQAGRTQEEYNMRYYEEILAVTQQFKHYSILGHLDMIRRYDSAGDFPFDKIKDVVAEILRTAIDDGKGIEINTSSFDYGLPDLTPARDILRLYKDLGGRILTIGSDAHTPQQLGRYFDVVQKEALAFGFTEYCTFKAMQPQFHKL